LLLLLIADMNFAVGYIPFDFCSAPSTDLTLGDDLEVLKIAFGISKTLFILMAGTFTLGLLDICFKIGIGDLEGFAS